MTLWIILELYQTTHVQSETADTCTDYGQKVIKRKLLRMGYLRRLFPPYYKYAVFLFVGFEIVFTSTLLAISEAYYKSAASILPIAYRIFDDTVQKQAPGFTWTEEDRQQLEMYKFKMLVMWIVSTIGVLLCMLIIIPQFFDFNDSKGNPSHLCLVRHRIAYMLTILVAIFVVILGVSVTWAWYGGGAATQSFHRHFQQSEKEETYLTEFEEKLGCELDDDKEVPDWHRCEHNVKVGFISELWLNLILFTYFFGHIVAFLAIPFFNRQLIKPDEDDLLLSGDDKKHIEA